MGKLGPIEKGIPVAQRGHARYNFRLHELTEVGMSRTYTLSPRESVNNSMTKMLQQGKQLEGRIFKCRTINKATRTIRIWRTQ